jgi:hypothetical protein
VIPIDESDVLLALESDFSDFEDTMQYFSVRASNIDTIITRNVTDYKVTDIHIKTAEEYIEWYVKEKQV